MNADTSKYFYLKDHLGSTRAVINTQNQVVSAQDYDPWGYIFDTRSYDNGNDKYKFTGKERDRDIENNYDYFGARYYDSRIGRWNGVEPLLDKYVGVTPYNYSLNNPIIMIDPNGKDPYRENLGSLNQVLDILAQNENKSYWDLSKVFAENEVRFIYTEKGGFIDLRHFFASAEASSIFDKNTAIIAGELEEKRQEITNNESANDPEDRPSNLQGAIFGEQNKTSENVSKNFESFMEGLSPLKPEDPKIAQDKLYIPFNKRDKPLPERISYEPYHGESPNFNRRNIIK